MKPPRRSMLMGSPSSPLIAAGSIRISATICCRLAADEVHQVECRGGLHDRGYRALDVHPQDVVLGHQLADSRDRGERRGRHRSAEAKLDLVDREVVECLDPVDLDQPALTEGGHPAAALLDLAD